MKIAVATERGGLDDAVSPNFGRAPSITFVDVDDATGEIVSHEVLPNPFAGASSGAGTRVSQLVAEKGATVVLAGAFGPKAARVLEATGVRAVPASGSVREAVRAVVSGAPPAGDVPGPGASPGTGAGPGWGPPGGAQLPPGAGPGAVPGPGFGAGFGPGMGPGGGWGRGGGGGGRGRGGGWGRGGGGGGRGRGGGGWGRGGW